MYLRSPYYQGSITTQPQTWLLSRSWHQFNPSSSSHPSPSAIKIVISDNGGRCTNKGALPLKSVTILHLLSPGSDIYSHTSYYLALALLHLKMTSKMEFNTYGKKQDYVNHRKRIHRQTKIQFFLQCLFEKCSQYPLPWLMQPYNPPILEYFNFKVLCLCFMGMLLQRYVSLV